MRLFLRLSGIVLFAGVVVAAIMTPAKQSSLVSGLSPAVEIAELETRIALTKEAGFPINPEWTARLAELLPLVSNHPANVQYDYPLQSGDGGFAPGAVIRPQQLTPLEQQIRELEFQFSGGLGSEEPDAVTRAALKEQLHELYMQRNIRENANPLDQGADFCPGTLVTGIPYTDTGTTAGMGNYYNPIAPCAPTASPEVVYRFEPSLTMPYTISLLGSSYDTYLYVNTAGACPGALQLACNDDFGGLQSQVSLTLSAGQTYFIIVDGYGTGSFGDYVLNISDNCDITCQPGDVIECPEVRESLHAGTDCNGSCNRINYGGAPVSQDILPFQTICGRGFTYIGPTGGNFRDTDAYRFTLTEACSLSVTITSEFVVNMVIVSASCPFTILHQFQTWSFACSTVTYISPCFQPGTYDLFVGPSAVTGIEEMREYRVRLDLIPCNGCRIDAALNAPGSIARNTCDAGNDCTLRGSQEVTYGVTIPHDGDWTFSLCGPDIIWDSFIYLTSSCCGGVIASNDDGCGGVGLSTINCRSLTRGVYYLTVEGFNSTHCGPHVLTVSECQGACCYGDPYDPTCAYIGQAECEALGGRFRMFEPCSTDACPSLLCVTGSSVSHSPRPVENGLTGLYSDIETGWRCYDNYNTVGNIQALRFWGFWGDVCVQQPASFEVLFVDTASNESQIYTAALIGTPTGVIVSGVYEMYEYNLQLVPPCPISTGWLSIYGTNPTGCSFAWASSQEGDLSAISYLGAEPYPLTVDLAFCMAGSGCEIDSLTILWDPSLNYPLHWWQSHAGTFTLYYSLVNNPQFPADYLAAGTIPAWAGPNASSVFIPIGIDFVTFLGQANCSPPAAGQQQGPLILRVGQQ